MNLTFTNEFFPEFHKMIRKIVKGNETRRIDLTFDFCTSLLNMTSGIFFLFSAQCIQLRDFSLPTTAEATLRMNQLYSAANSSSQSFNVEERTLYTIFTLFEFRSLPFSFSVSCTLSPLVIPCYTCTLSNELMSHMTVKPLFLTFKKINESC